MIFSVIICTYNRADLLKETVKSLINIVNGQMDIEVIIVDNNSTDHTLSALGPFINDSQQIKYFLETNQGLSHSRNRGIQEASGKVIIFFDDDIDIDPGYFETCRELLRSEDYQIFGGKVLPYKVDIPRWLPSKFYYLASIFDIGNHRQVVAKVMGANYGMTKEVASQVGWYDPELGRKGKNLMGGEEVDYLNRASLLGYKVQYIPELVVYHKINEKLNFKYIYDYSLLLGKSESLIDLKIGRYKVLKKCTKSVIAICLDKVIASFLPSSRTKTYMRINGRYGVGYLNSIIMGK